MRRVPGSNVVGAVASCTPVAGRVAAASYDSCMTYTALLPILVAGIVAAFIGFVWYHPKVFGGAWMRLHNMTPEMVERAKKRMPFMAFAGLLAAMLVAWVMGSVLTLFQVGDIVSAVVVAFWCWLGFIAPTMLGMVLWEQKSFKLYLITSVYWLVALIAMALVLFFF